MRFTNATWARRHFAALLADAQSDPIALRRRSRDTAVVISSQEYARLRGRGFSGVVIPTNLGA